MQGSGRLGVALFVQDIVASRPVEKVDFGLRALGEDVRIDSATLTTVHVSTWIEMLRALASVMICMWSLSLQMGSTSCWKNSLTVHPTLMKCLRKLLLCYR